MWQLGDKFYVEGYGGQFKLTDDLGFSIVLEHTKTRDRITLGPLDYHKLTPVSSSVRHPTTTSSASSYYQPTSTTTTQIPSQNFQVGNLVQLSNGRTGKVMKIPLSGDALKVQLNNGSTTIIDKYLLTKKPTATTTTTTQPTSTTTTAPTQWKYPQSQYAPWQYTTHNTIPWLDEGYIGSFNNRVIFNEGDSVNLKYPISGVTTGYIFAIYDASQAPLELDDSPAGDSPYIRSVQGPIYIIRDAHSLKYIYSPAINIEQTGQRVIQLPTFNIPKGKLVRIHWPENTKVDGLIARTTEDVTNWNAHIYANDPRRVISTAIIPTELLTPVYQYPRAPDQDSRATHQLLFVSHGTANRDSSGQQITFKMPDNVELVHFETSEDNISFITADIVISKLRDMIPEYRIKNGVEQIDFGKWEHHPSKTASDGQYRVVVHRANSTTAENFNLELTDTRPIIQDAIGFYDTDNAYIDFQTVLGWFTPPNPPTTGKDVTLTNDFVRTIPPQQFPWTDVQTLVRFVSYKYSISHPGQVIRLFLICCRIGHTNLRQVTGTSTNIQNVSNYNSLGGRRLRSGRKQRGLKRFKRSRSKATRRRNTRARRR